MNIDYRPRQTGKTTDLIKKADKCNGYIVTGDKRNVNCCMEIAKEIKCEINMPLTFDEFLSKKYYGKGIKKFHIDDAEYLIQRLTNVPIENITISRTGHMTLQEQFENEVRKKPVILHENEEIKSLQLVLKWTEDYINWLEAKLSQCTHNIKEHITEKNVFPYGNTCEYDKCCICGKIMNLKII